MTRTVSRAALLLAIGATSASGQDLSCPATLDKSHVIDEKATLYYAVVPSDPPEANNGILCGRLEATNDGWIGLGFSEGGLMSGSDAIIGTAGENMSVKKYDLTTVATEMAAGKQTLRNTMCTVDKGLMIMSFTKLLVEEGEIPIAETGKNKFLHARGGDTLGYHTGGRTSFEVDFGGADGVTEAGAVKIGDEVCITNYIMDQFCINRGTFLDNPDVMTLKEPEKHSFHCLLDVGLCRNSGYMVLTDKDASTGMHCLGYRLGDTDAVYNAGIAAGYEGETGYCTDCTGDSTKPEYGYIATVKGTVAALGDGSDGPLGAPLLENLEVLDSSVECDIPTVVDPVCMEVPSTDPPPTSTPDPPVTEPTGPTKDCTKEMCESQLSDDYLLMYQINVPDDTTLDVCEACTISMELIYNGDAWVSIGFSNDGKMIGSEAVIGSSSLSVQKYSLGGKDVGSVQPMPESQQTLIDTSVEATGGQTIMKFTKIMKEAGEVEISPADNTFIWAHGSSPTLAYHSAREILELNLSSGASEEVAVPNKSAWLAHGIMAFIAWGVLVPWAVQSSLLRDLLPKGPVWFQLHRAFNTTAFAMFIAAFAVGVAYTSKEGGTHFDNDHQKMGLSMFILAFAQVLGGVFRPHATEPGEEKTPVRLAFEVGHRVLGVALLACGFWQMREGIALYSIKYSVSESNEDKLSLAYWVWIGVMSAIIVIGGGFFKLRNKSTDDEAPLAAADSNVGEGADDKDEAA